MMPSAGSQYGNIAGSKEIGGLLKKGADNLAKGATKARRIQGQYKTKKLGEIKAGIRERKTAYESTMAEQKKSLDARTASEEMAKFQAAKEARIGKARELKQAKYTEQTRSLQRATRQNLGGKKTSSMSPTRNVAGTPRSASSSVSRSQMTRPMNPSGVTYGGRR